MIPPVLRSNINNNNNAIRIPESSLNSVICVNIELQLKLVLLQCFQAGFRFDHFYRCVETDFSDDPKAVKMSEVTWYILFIKFTELLETILFVLRKKQNQVSFLHVYHHISTFFIAYIFCKYVGGKTIVS